MDVLRHCERIWAIRDPLRRRHLDEWTDDEKYARLTESLGQRPVQEYVRADLHSEAVALLERIEKNAEVRAETLGDAISATWVRDRVREALAALGGR